MTVSNPGRSYILSCVDHGFSSDITCQTAQLFITQSLRPLCIAEMLKKKKNIPEIYEPHEDVLAEKSEKEVQT